ncbi:hypothetical protein HO173_005919 [Letharia columbiana]|uniref:Uncharacterized protein n=1 Tax=Letharia columbiana TaxID=112416 RepID=A0A8H6FVX3_9LECA|nr:uncharacterized protein HO173_005919 [Letharia columbiana]KAF6235724.1 hypothetical protein HO173_005919 [Letharia columbiana]
MAKTQNHKKTKRQATLYDAVAGRVSSTGFIPPTPRVSAYRDTPSSSTVAVPPEEVLFRRKGAPIRYEEDDVYWADRHLSDKQKLPESDLLKAIHAYAADFYGRAVKGRGMVDFESLDETALLAVGVLLEEKAGEALGETGDLAFVEGEDDEAQWAEEGALPEEVTSSGEDHRESTAAASEVTSEAATSDKGNNDKDKRRHKRRKTRHDHDRNG